VGPSATAEVFAAFAAAAERDEPATVTAPRRAASARDEASGSTALCANASLSATALAEARTEATGWARAEAAMKSRLMVPRRWRRQSRTEGGDFG